MSKKEKGRKKGANKASPSSSPIKKIGAIIMVVLLLAFVGGAWLVPLLAPKTNTPIPSQEKPFEPPFVKEGELSFWRANGNDKITSIDIEFAKTEQEITNGLMFRRNMADSVGMLFIFPRTEPRSFWMKNTYISLDIIYIGEDHKIVSIADSAQPLSTESLPSKGPAKYVLEVVGGFCETHNIQAGDFITYE